MTYRDLTGKVFNKITVINRVGEDKKRQVIWSCQCICGNIINVTTYKLKNKKSCGCDSVYKYKGVMSIANQVFGHGYKDGDLTLSQFYTLSQKDCYYCSKPPSNCWNKKHGRKRNLGITSFIYNGLDRVDNNLPHNLDNVVPCCWPCNQKKKAQSQTDYIQHAENIVLNQIWNEIKELYETRTN